MRAVDPDLDAYPLMARELCERAVNGEHGVRVFEAIYREVTEDSDPGPKYSSCADLAHWMLFRLGVREPYINRKEHLGRKPVVNVGRLCARPIGGGAGGAARKPRPSEVFTRGDTLICWSHPKTLDAHVFVCDSHDEASGELRSWDYGQGPMKPEAWSTSRNHIEGCRRVRKARLLKSGLWAFPDGRIIHSVLPLRDAIDFAYRAGRLMVPGLPIHEVTL